MRARDIAIATLAVLPILPVALSIDMYRLPEAVRARAVSLEGTWKIFEATGLVLAGAEVDDSDWKDFTIPGSHLLQGFGGSESWLRRTFELPPHLVGQDLVLTLGDTRSGITRVFINGHFVGEQGVPSRHFKVGLTDPEQFPVDHHLLAPGRNTIALHVQWATAPPDGIMDRYDGIPDHRLMLGSSQDLRGRFLSASLMLAFFRVGSILVSLVVVALLLGLLASEWTHGDRLRTLTLIGWMVSEVSYQAVVTGVFTLPFSVNVRVESIFFIAGLACLFAIEFAEHYFLGRKTRFRIATRGIIAVLLAMGLVVHVVRPAGGVPLYDPLMLWTAVCLIYIDFLAIRDLFRRRNPLGLLFTSAVLVVTACWFSDLLAISGLVRLPLLHDLAAGSVPVCAAIVVFGEFFSLSALNKQLMGSLSDANRDLTKAVAEGTTARQQLAESEERFELAVRGANEALWDWDLRTDQVYVSSAWRKMLGLPIALGERGQRGPRSEWTARIHPDDLERFERDVQAHLSAETERLETEQRLLHQDGSYVYTVCRGAAQREESGNVYRMLGTQVDISELRRAEQEKKAFQEQLERARKLEALGKLAGGIAHDFNNILSAIIGYSELAKSAVTDPQAYKDLGEVLAAAERARALVAQVLSFSRGKVSEPQQVALAPLVNEAVHMLGLDGSGTTLRTVFDSQPLVTGEASGLHQVVLNLCVNARDAVEGAGHVTITLSEGPIRGVCASCNQPVDDTFAVMSIEDDGPGISPQVLHQIFEPFFTTKQRRGGTGLGLPMVHGVVHAHRGHILLETRPGMTRFTVLLPPARSVSQPAASSDVPAPVATGTGRLLVVDDDPQVGEVLARGLKKRGFDVVHVHTAEAAIHFATNEAFLALITDYQMPDMNGVQLVHALREHHSWLPAILCTGNDTAVGDSSELVAVMTKPVDINDLVRRVTALSSASAVAGALRATPPALKETHRSNG